VQIDSDRFGPMEVDEERVVTIVGGIPGFPALRRVVVLEARDVPEAIPPAVAPHAFWIQDVDHPTVSFLAIVPWPAFPDYDVPVDRSHLDVADDELAVLVLVSVHTDRGAPLASANLRAPLVVDTRHRRMHQLILTDSCWAVDAPLSPPAAATRTTEAARCS